MTSTTHLHSVQDDAARFEAGHDITDRGSAAAPPTGGDNGSGTDRPVRAPKKARAARPLPTDRLSFSNQVAVLKNVAITSGNNRRGSDSYAMSAAIGLKGETGGLNSRFFRSAGWFELAEARGDYTASPGTLAWNQHVSVDPTAQFEATAQMRAEVARSWFWETLQPMLESGQPIRESLALVELAKAAGATDHGSQLTMILEWLEWVGLVVREEGQIRLRSIEEAPADAADDEKVDSVENESEANAAELTASTSASTARPNPSVDTEAIVSFNLSVRLTADDLQSMDETQRDFVLALAERLRG
ncbi:hypothetical protein [Nocardioides stalactiti]|uniref:hypothetical protein n=1 Tax=Nocardioides stalactiti TaxID=2755356 RepID=UPI0016024636|nr:hypothetical protein [Nocardioides stalactiti]